VSSISLLLKSVRKFGKTRFFGIGSNGMKRMKRYELNDIMERNINSGCSCQYSGKFKRSNKTIRMKRSNNTIRMKRHNGMKPNSGFSCQYSGKFKPVSGRRLEMKSFHSSLCQFFEYSCTGLEHLGLLVGVKIRIIVYVV
jgi:hypothetical protein